MTRESKLIIASNLTLASILRDKMFRDKDIDPDMDSRSAIMQIFSELVSLLDQNYPDKI